MNIQTENNKPSNSPIKEELLNKVDVAYSSEPWWYDLRGFMILTLAYRSTLTHQINFFSNNIKNQHLEIAIGTGTLLSYILKWRQFNKLTSQRIVGFDYADRMLEGAKKRFAQLANMELVKADAADLPYKAETFDSANVANALHCIPDIDACINEAFRVLKPGGTLAGNALIYPKGNGPLDRLATAINIWGMKKGILYSPLESETVRNKLMKSGFILTHENTSGNCYDFIAMKPK